ncbi:glycosyltransferase family 2 protein [Sulfitobacter sp. S190]|uniref:glycosyltransferase family 2 protein n=1 Tax=Sulfitobacter sp. S190 TaxID=2867022 RepID=UPI0021A7A388|nr:glycosyltransferase family 2 protein [Sulfitobacter sp. S190]UWR24448.1 glycosyltransferase family 2 protein [Sulfitobacter sp. S190]
MPEPTRFTILLCTYQGAAHLSDQLQSYLDQSHDAWDLWISDDGSRDETRDLIDSFRTRAGPKHDVRMVEGPRQGSTANFMSLLCHPDLPSQPVALSDQDDVWLPHKLARASEILAQAQIPTLYGAQSRHVDADLNPLGYSSPPRRPVGFANALTQNVVSGHSTVLNTAALALVRQRGVPAQDVPYHDWWLYQLISGAGGRVVIDPETVLLYRQHTGNVMGAHRGPAASLARMRMVFGRRYGNWLSANMAALAADDRLLTPQAKTALQTLQAAPRSRPLKRVLAFGRAGLYRQTLLATCAMYLAVALGRV